MTTENSAIIHLMPANAKLRAVLPAGELYCAIVSEIVDSVPLSPGRGVPVQLHVVSSTDAEGF